MYVEVELVENHRAVRRLRMHVSGGGQGAGRRWEVRRRRVTRDVDGAGIVDREVHAELDPAAAEERRVGEGAARGVDLGYEDVG
jgi:hypothetical protein